MWSIKVIKVFPLLYFLVQINIIRVVQQLMEFLLVRKVRPFLLSVELRPSCLYIAVLHAKVLYMPVEPGLELVPVVGLDGMDSERELIDNIIHKVNGT